VIAWFVVMVGVAVIVFVQRVAKRFGHQDRVSEMWVADYFRNGRDRR
jgi:hypothetical protein